MKKQDSLGATWLYWVLRSPTPIASSWSVISATGPRSGWRTACGGSLGGIESTTGFDKLDAFLNRLSSYDLLNIFLPGIALAAFTVWLFPGLENGLDSFLMAFAGCYIAGVSASRVGSLLVEWLALKLKVVTRSSYDSFIEAEKRDPKIEGLVAISNMYRTLAGAAILMLAEIALHPVIETVGEVILPFGCAALAMLLLPSWVKQERYISRRIELQKDGLENEQD